MWSGSLHGACLVPGERWDTSWDESTPLQRRIVRGIMKSIRENLLKGDVGECASRDEDAFRRIVKTSASSYGGIEAEAGTDCFPRGAVCPLVPSELSVPPAGVQPVDPTLYSSSFRHYYKFAEEMMLRPAAAVDRDEYNRAKTYCDPALKEKSTLLGLLLRFWDAGMLSFCADSNETVSIFSVVKSDAIDSDGVRTRRSRVVWDERRPNLLFHTPP